MKRKAFTLVELLVVLAVIAVLAAMLLPAIARARRAAGLVQCTANLKNLGNAMMVYATRHNGCLIVGSCGSSQPAFNNWYFEDSWNKYIHLGMLTATNILAREHQVNFKKADGTNIGKINVGFAPKQFYCPLESNRLRMFASNSGASMTWVANPTANPWPPISGNRTVIGYGTRPVYNIHSGSNGAGGWPVGSLKNVPYKSVGFDSAKNSEIPEPVAWKRIGMMSNRSAWASDYIGGSSGLRSSHPECVNVLYFDQSVQRLNVAGFVKTAIVNSNLGTSTGHLWWAFDRQ